METREDDRKTAPVQPGTPAVAAEPAGAKDRRGASSSAPSASSR